MEDQVTLKNGDRLTGTIVKSNAKTLLVAAWRITTFSDRFLSDPLPGLKKNDLLLSTGVRRG